MLCDWLGGCPPVQRDARARTRGRAGWHRRGQSADFSPRLALAGRRGDVGVRALPSRVLPAGRADPRDRARHHPAARLRAARSLRQCRVDADFRAGDFVLDLGARRSVLSRRAAGRRGPARRHADSARPQPRVRAGARQGPAGGRRHHRRGAVALRADRNPADPRRRDRPQPARRAVEVRARAAAGDRASRSRCRRSASTSRCSPSSAARSASASGSGCRSSRATTSRASRSCSIARSGWAT